MKARTRSKNKKEIAMKEEEDTKPDIIDLKDEDIKQESDDEEIEIEDFDVKLEGGDMKTNDVKVEPVHNCKECGFNAASINTLKVHIEMVHLNLYFYCGQCSYKTKEKYILKAHIEKRHKSSDYQNIDFECRKCEIREPVKAFQDHIILFHQEFKHLFAGSRGLFTKEKGSRKCNFCDFSDRTSLVKSHIEYRHMSMKYYCMVCNENYTDKIKMKTHLKRKHYNKIKDGVSEAGRVPHSFIRGKMKSVCLSCNEELSPEENLGNHILSKHPMKFTNTSMKGRVGKTIDGQYKCNKCDYTSNIRYNLRTHIMLSHLKTVFECHCGHKTRQLALMRRHEGEHKTPDTTSTCSLCVFITKDNVEFLKHVNEVHVPYLEFSNTRGRRVGSINSTEKKHMCEECDYKCIQKINLRKHVMVKHMKTKFKCYLCDHETAFLDLMKKHVIENHSSTGFSSECTKCDFETEDLSNFKKHTKQIHLSHGGYDHRIGGEWQRGRRGRKFKKILVKHDEEPTYKCYQCNVETMSKTDIIEHIFENHDVNDHLDEDEQLDEILKFLKMLCKGCGFEGTFENWKEHKDEKVFKEVPKAKIEKGQCGLCGSHTNSAPDALVHKLIAHGQCKYSCKLCEFDAKKQGILVKHNKKEHDKISTYYGCNYCEIRQLTASQMNFHMETQHSEIYNMKADVVLNKCKLCEFQHISQRKIEMHNSKIHNITHMKGKTCSECNTEFSNRLKVIRHIRMEHEKYVYNCPEEDCDFKTKHESALFRHKYVVHLERRFQCDHCDRSFTRNEYLKQHRNHFHMRIA